jgi:uncharacterized glyoxalase superfamily protein PhnB
MSVANNPPPKGWPRISASVHYSNAAKAIDWLCKAFGFEVQLRVDGEGGRIEHSQLTIGKGGDGLIMLGDKKAENPLHSSFRSPKELGGVTTQSLMVYVDDVDAHCVRAKEAGATIDKEPTTTDYGDDYWTDRGYGAIDHEGHHWYFVQRLRNPKA